MQHITFMNGSAVLNTTAWGKGGESTFTEEVTAQMAPLEVGVVTFPDSMNPSLKLSPICLSTLSDQNQTLNSPKAILCSCWLLLNAYYMPAFKDTIEFNPHSNFLKWALFLSSFYQGRDWGLEILLKEAQSCGSPLSH